MLGVACAAVSRLFCYTLHFMEHTVPKLFPNPWVRVFAGGVLVLSLLHISFRVGFCYLAVLCFGGGLLSIWMGMYLDWVFRSLCFYLRFRRGSWLEQSVI